jgi:hypothetical protein
MQPSASLNLWRRDIWLEPSHPPVILGPRARSQAMPRRHGTKPSKMKEETSEMRLLNIYEGEQMFQRNRPLCALDSTVGDSVISVKNQIQGIEGFAPDHQRIFKANDYLGAQLEDDYKLIASDFRWGLVAQFPMHIFVSLVSGETLAVDVMRSESIDEVEDKVWELLSMPFPEVTQRQFDRMLQDTKMQNVVTSPFMKFRFGATPLSITRTIASYGIPSGATLTCEFEKIDDDA